MNQVFRTDFTDIPFYDAMLKRPDYFCRAKGLVFEIRFMSPREYMREAAKLQNTSIVMQYMMVDRKLVERYVYLARQGARFPMLLLDYANNVQEGRHRAVMAEKLGIASVPVMIINKVKENNQGSTSDPRGAHSTMLKIVKEVSG